MQTIIDEKGNVTTTYMAPEYREVAIKPWGKYENIYLNPHYKVKILTIDPGKRISLQRHKWRDEIWTVVEGSANVTLEGTNLGLFTFNTIRITNGNWHRVTNNQQTPLVIVEVQTGNCYEEDIERIEDDYGRM